METDLEQRFFEAFELGGIADTCMRWALGSPEWLPEKWGRLVEEREREVIEETYRFDFSIITSGKTAPIFREIQANLRQLSGRERENYILGLLTPFKDWMRTIRGRADEGETEWSKENLRQQSKQIFEILNEDYEEGTIKGALQGWDNIVINYSNRLDAILLQEGEDLLRYQRIAGVRLIEHRDLSVLGYYCGSEGVAKKYIADLTPTPQPDTSTLIPDSASTSTLWK